MRTVEIRIYGQTKEISVGSLVSDPLNLGWSRSEDIGVLLNVVEKQVIDELASRIEQLVEIV